LKDADSNSPFILLVLTPQGVSEHALPSRGKLTIGRGDDNMIRVSDPSVSRHHAVLEVGETLRIQDLGGANGTYVQRMRQTVAVAGQTESLHALRSNSVMIQPGDRMVLGAAQLVVRRGRRTVASAGAWDANYVVSDRRMTELYAQVDRMAASRVSVLIYGETGVGKDVVAQRLHLRSPRKEGPFVPINSAALTETLLETELFGAEKGAYTGAIQRPGLFETADHGTLFLDEIGELSLATQAKLLRVLEDRKVTRVGGRTPRDVDVRFVAATNRDLKQACDQGSFRADLFFRLAGMVLQIPPLRDRPTEIEPLARLLLDRACEELERPPLELSPDVLEAITRHAWPGNVRELKNAMDQAAVLCAGPRVEQEHLPATIPAWTGQPRVPAPPPPANAVSPTLPADGAVRVLKEDLRHLEKERILKALEQCSWNQTRAAEVLGIARRTLINRLDEYEVARPRKR
jgi:DNA-binding NtrC family response regulator